MQSRPVVYSPAQPETTRDRLIATGLRFLLARGYEGTGIGPVLAEAGVPKGSFYHHFASKDDFAAAVVEAYAARYGALRARVFAEEARPAIARVEAYFAELRSELARAHPDGGCLYGCLAQTATARSPAFRAALAAAYADWHASLAEQIAAARAAGEIDPAADVEAIAGDLVDLYEGCIVRAKITGDTAAFASLGRYLAGLRRPRAG